MTKLLVATKNKSKLVELNHLLRQFQKGKRKRFQLVSLKEFPHIRSIREDGKTFEENAVKKARGYSRKTGLLTLAEDSGLCVDALGGRPGVYSARFAGAQKSDAANCRKVLKLLQRVKNPNKRRAHFYCAVALSSPSAVIGVVRGKVTGRIAFRKEGQNGFGYDPLMYYPAFRKTFGQVRPAVKNRVSHRFRALKRAISLLNSI